MPEHYFTASPTSPHAQRAVTLTALGVKMRLVTDAGVFSREGLDAGTRILLEALPPLAGRVLDLGCGLGRAGADAGQALSRGAVCPYRPQRARLPAVEAQR